MALVKNANLDEWKILFKGLAVVKKNHQIDYERLNKYGITGCLNFYKVHFKSTSLIANRGLCEDTINIINSSGNIENIEIVDAFSDGLDIDFSDMKVKKIVVKNAGNDCFDVSSGDYFIKHVIASNCSDKALSVGEKSNLLLNSFLVENLQLVFLLKIFLQQQ